MPKKYVEKVGEDGFKKAPIGAGPYKFVSFNPAIDLVLEAFDGYWRKVPSVKRLVFRSMPDETTRAAALKAGDVDIVYLLSGPVAAEVKRSTGLRLAAAMPPGVVFLDLPEQWDPKSPWARPARASGGEPCARSQCPQSGRDARTLAADRRARPARPRSSRRRSSRPPTIRRAPRSFSPRPGIPRASTPASCTPFPPYFSLAEAIGNYLQEVGIRTRMRTMERAAFLTAWREHKIKGVIMGLGAPAGNAATRIEVYVTKSGIYASGVVPEIEDLYQRQGRELDRKKRESLLHQIQQIVYDRADVRADLRARVPLGRRTPRRGSVRRPHQGLFVLGALRGSEAQAGPLSRSAGRESRRVEALLARIIGELERTTVLGEPPRRRVRAGGGSRHARPARGDSRGAPPRRCRRGRRARRPGHARVRSPPRGSASTTGDGAISASAR